MATRIFIPTPLRAFTGNQSQVEVEADDVRAALDALVADHPGIRAHLFDETGALRSFVNIYLNDDDIRYLAPEATRVNERDIISIIPAIAGGASE